MDDNYSIFSNGQIWSLRNKIFLKWNKNTEYARVKIYGKYQYVHRLVANKFIPNPYNKPQVNHKDLNKLNNDYTNLEWVTSKQNIQHSVSKQGNLLGRAKITREQAEEIRNIQGLLQKDIAKKYGISISSVSYIRNNKRWKSSHLDLEFQGYLLDRDRTDKDLLDWIKYIEDILAERGVNID